MEKLLVPNYYNSLKLPPQVEGPRQPPKFPYPLSEECQSSRHRHTNYCATFKLSAHQMAKFKRVVCCPDSNWYKCPMESCKSFPNPLRDNLLFKQPYLSPQYKQQSSSLTRCKCQSKSRHLHPLSNSLQELWFIPMEQQQPLLPTRPLPRLSLLAVATKVLWQLHCNLDKVFRLEQQYLCLVEKPIAFPKLQ